jgi:hypothetical protein
MKPIWKKRTPWSSLTESVNHGPSSCALAKEGWLLLGLSLMVSSCGAGIAETEERFTSTSDALVSLVDSPFTIRGLGGKCVDFGGEAYWAIGSPVFLYSCNGTSAQRVRVVELADGTHDVTLRAGARFCIGIRDTPRVGVALELQACNDGPRQRFALDGDAIYAGTQSSGRVNREFVVAASQGRSIDRTPLVLALQETTDAEYFGLKARVSLPSGRPRVFEWFRASATSTRRSLRATGGRSLR